MSSNIVKVFNPPTHDNLVKRVPVQPCLPCMAISSIVFIGGGAALLGDFFFQGNQLLRSKSALRTSVRGSGVLAIGYGLYQGISTLQLNSKNSSQQGEEKRIVSV